MDKYRVVEWAQISPHTSCCFAYVELTDAIKQAIVNDIRANGYFFGDEALFGGELQVCPVLNTGEAVLLSDDDCKELVCKAYGLKEDEYERYLHHVVKNPYIDIATQKKYTCEYPIKRVVWINDDAFDDFKASILSGKSNVDIIPDDYIQLKKGDVVRYTSVDEGEYFEVQIKESFPDNSNKISDLANINKVDTQSILDLFAKNASASNEHLLYRYDGESGQAICKEFERIYGTWLLQDISTAIGKGEFFCRINLIVFDKNVNFEQTVLDMSDDTPVSDEVASEIKQKCDDYLSEVQRAQEEQRLRILRLKEKMAKRKNGDN